MLLSDVDLLAAIESGRLGISPFTPTMIQPASIDVRLDRFFRVARPASATHIDPAVQQGDITDQIEIVKGQPFVLHPGEFALGSTYESVRMSDALAARFEGKSSLGRLGLLTHATAGFIDPGFAGHITLELASVATLPITLWPGMKIGQLCVMAMTTPAARPYGTPGVGSHYQNQRGPTASRSYKNFHITDIYGADHD